MADKKSNDPSDYFNSRNFNNSGGLHKLGKGSNFNDSGSIKADTIEELIKSAGIQNSSNMGWLTKFARFSYVDPYNTPKGTKEYVIITKPDLHMFEGNSSSELNTELKKDVFFSDCFDRYRHIMAQLQYSANRSNPYLTVLSNSVANSLEVPDIVALESETNENIYGDKITYRHGSSSGDVGFEFSLEFYDTPTYELYYLFKMWDLYYEYKTAGKVTPPSKSYIKNMELHDQICMYKIIVSEDMETIVWYAKYYGVYPKEIPRSSFGSIDTGPFKISVSFKAAFVLDNRPDILQQLNQTTLEAAGVSSVKSLKESKIWDSDNKRVNRDWVGMPYVVLDKSVSNGDFKNGSEGVYKLKWGE